MGLKVKRVLKQDASPEEIANLMLNLPSKTTDEVGCALSGLAQPPQIGSNQRAWI